MKVLVTGATGFLGANLVHHLVKRGDEVRILKRAKTPLTLLEGLDIEVALGDITDFKSLVEATRGVEGVYHVAGLVSYWPPKRPRQTRVNVDGTRLVVQAAAENKVRRLVHTSSIAAVGYDPAGGQVDENTRWNWGPQDIHYCTTKYLGEKEAFKGVDYGLEVVALNPALIFGPRDTSWNAGRMFKMVMTQTTVRMPAGSTTTCDVDDVCAGHIAAMDRGRSGERYILGGEQRSYAALFEEIAAVAGRQIQMQTVPFWAAYAAAWGLYGVSMITRKEPDLTPELIRMARLSRKYTSEKAKRELGYPQTPLRESLEKTFRWYRENGYL
jgi:dihydroflavonol-4-reductase